MPSKNIIAFLCSIFLLISCSKKEIDNQISYEIIDQSTLSYSDENKIPKQFKVFESENEWMDFLPVIERVNPDQAESLRNLKFDFTSNNLIFVIGEFYNYCCSEITIDKVYENDGKIMVDFKESGPGSATALSQAYLILKSQKIR
ncbi:hypothetical protein SAMN04487911_13041 [Arenibacter nanhaiticus]|uniref:Lipoprotein n=1 Tax=Arenibacter nanhaiticus TaxID=558155 RepID=A0A1M6LAK6_9FLAO|nr:protease complex subunit PrcB family protein [Arenibacter nanhaiticus]SHJ68228.1 hypothetical protein SAMN04487911_13041 [Arenibacter nanhaiticus]